MKTYMRVSLLLIVSSTLILAFSKQPDAPIKIRIMREFTYIEAFQQLSGFHVDTEERTQELMQLWKQGADQVYDTISDSLVNAISDYNIDNGTITLKESDAYSLVYLGMSDSVLYGEMTLAQLPSKNELVQRFLTLFIAKDLKESAMNEFIIKVTGSVLE